MDACSRRRNTCMRPSGWRTRRAADRTTTRAYHPLQHASSRSRLQQQRPHSGHGLPVAQNTRESLRVVGARGATLPEPCPDLSAVAEYRTVPGASRLRWACGVMETRENDSARALDGCEPRPSREPGAAPSNSHLRCVLIAEIHERAETIDASPFPSQIRVVHSRTGRRGHVRRRVWPLGSGDQDVEACGRQGASHLPTCGPQGQAGARL